jgi:hypothetical protein
MLPRERPGADLVAVVAAGVVAAKVAVVLRSVAGTLARTVLHLWTWFGIAVAALGVCVLGAGGPPRVVWALGAAAAVAVVRLLPLIAVNAPDEQLLDTARMAVTRWSARGNERGKRIRVHTDEVAAEVSRGRNLLAVGTIGSAILASGYSSALCADPGPGWTRWAAFGAAGLVGLAMLLSSRDCPDVTERLAIRLGGAGAALAGAGGAVAWASWGAREAVGGGVLVVAIPARVAAAFLGRGWSSVWWSRLGDAVETASVALSAPVAVLACGSFDYFRGMFS